MVDKWSLTLVSVSSQLSMVFWLFPDHHLLRHLLLKLICLMLARYLSLTQPLIIFPHSALVCAIIDKGMLILEHSEAVHHFLTCSDMGALLQLEQPEHHLSQVPVEPNFILRVGNVSLIHHGVGCMALSLQMMHPGFIKYNSRESIKLLKRRLVYLSNVLRLLLECIVAQQEALVSFNRASEEWWLETLGLYNEATVGMGIRTELETVREEVCLCFPL